MISLRFHCSLHCTEGTNHIWEQVGLSPDVSWALHHGNITHTEMALGTVTTNRDSRMTTSGMVFSAYYSYTTSCLILTINLQVEKSILISQMNTLGLREAKLTSRR